MSLDELQPGDLIYSCDLECEFTPGCEYRNEIHHVRIYLGDGKVIEATRDEETLGGYTMVRDIQYGDKKYLSLLVRVVK